MSARPLVCCLTVSINSAKMFTAAVSDAELDQLDIGIDETEINL